MTTTLKQEWEMRLAKHGLSNRQLDVQDSLTVPTPTSETYGIQNHQFDKNIRLSEWKNSAAIHLGDDQIFRFHEIPVHVYHREIPTWVVSDETLRGILLSLFPRLATNPKHRLRAART